jgi:thiol-disulfide isomerase/thioredoxin
LKVGSKVYSNVTVVGANTTDLYFTHSQGIANVKLKYVDESLRSRFNYDSKAAEEAEKQQTQDDLAYQGTLAAKVVERVQKAALAAKKAASTSESSLADPISDSSLLGKAIPALEVDKWLGEKPVLKAKFGLIVFWAPWSIPCRKLIPQLNALQKKFADRLVVLGITSETQEDVEHMEEPKMEFTTGIDSKMKLSNFAGVSSIPYVLFVDQKGVIRYMGHPAALDEKKLESLIPKVLE